jgi:mannose-6-phosphate isomerase-like protein (cupin superfamily)
MSRYGVAKLDEIDEITDGREPWRPVRAHFGIRSFGVNAWTGKETGDRIINEHDEEGEDEELYVVQSGRARFELDGESVDAPAGTYVFAEPGVKRTAYAEEAGTTLLAIGARAGQAYEPSGWELWAPIAPLYQSGQYEEVADRAKPLVEAHPEYPLLAYNLACVESLVGRKEDAIEHLRQAAEKSERLREFAIDDSDLDAIRDDPRFKELVGA